MDLPQLAVLLAIARSGSPNAAAQEAGFTPTTFYRRLDSLERAAGAVLFHRQRGNWRPTQLGVKLIDIAVELESQMRDFRLAATSMDESKGGVLRVTTSDCFASFYLARHVSGFLSAQPMIAIDLIANNRRLDLSKGEADIAIRLHSMPGDKLIGRRAGRATHALFASASYLKSHGAPQSPGNLRQHRVLAYGRELGHFDAAQWTLEALQGRNPVAYFNDHSSMARAVENGLGIAVLPQFVGRQLAQVEQVALAGDGLPVDIWVVCHASQRRNKRVSAFTRYIAAQIKHDAALFT